MEKEMQLIIRAHNADGYTKDILDQTDRQVWMHDDRLETRVGFIGMFLDPEDFPEAMMFEIILQPVKETR